MKIALDVDGVLANFYLEFCKLHKMPHKTITEWEVKWIAEKLHTVDNNEDFWLRLPIINSPESISFDFDCYITSIPEQMKSIREQWLIKNGYPNKPVIVSHNKLPTMLKLGIDVIIDDKYSTIKSVSDAGLLGIHFIPYFLNPPIIHSINTKHLYDVPEIIKKYKKNKSNGKKMGRPSYIGANRA